MSKLCSRVIVDSKTKSMHVDLQLVKKSIKLIYTQLLTSYLTTTYYMKTYFCLK